MSNRFGSRATGCRCETNYTCGPCLDEAAHRAQAARFGVFATPTEPPPADATRPSADGYLTHDA